MAGYTAKSITVLEGLEPVRKRPGMYIGGVSSQGLHHLVWEILDNSVDEAMNGFASTIQVTLHANSSSLTVTDDGRGIPIDRHPRVKKPALEVILTTLHAGGKFDGQNYKTAGGLHGVGASVVNALSSQLVATVKRDGAVYEMKFKAGKPASKLRKVGRGRGTGTSITFHPDPKIFPKTRFNADIIRERLLITSYLHKGLRITFLDETSKQKHVFHHEEGLSAYLAKILVERSSKPVHESPFVLERKNDDDGTRLQIVVQWTESTDEHLRSYVNGIPTASGGSHENGFRAGLGKAIRNYIETHHLAPKGVTLSSEDLREGLTGVLSVFIKDPQFQGQTKDRLNNPEVQQYVDATLRPSLEHWLNHNRSTAEAIVARMILAARAREASRAASAAITRKTATKARLMLPGKLSDCSSTRSAGTELFIVEGDSAGGSAKQARDRSRQAVLPLRGKVLNAEQASLSKVLENKELADLVQALGCGLGKSFDLSKLRYDRVILLADADADGHHITTLLLTFIYRHMPELIRAGKVFIAQPPLYRIDIGKETHWAADDVAKARILSEHGGAAKGSRAGSKKATAKAGGPGTNTNSKGRVDITRFKGLGEMMPKVLWDTTLNPKTRRLLRVTIEDALQTDRVIADLMGKDPQARFRFIMERAEEAEELDV
jgi:DNA gyrase subunit B/topoisomerase-4 subunit B